MPLHYTHINLDDTEGKQVRDVEALEGFTSNEKGPETIGAYSDIPIKWVTLRGHSYMPAAVIYHNYQITVDGVNHGANTLPTVRLFAYLSSSQTYSLIFFNNPLAPGEEMEISFYASRGLTLNSSGGNDFSQSNGVAGSDSSNSNPKLVARLLYLSSNISPNSLSDFAGPHSSISPKLGEGLIPSSNGSNVGIVGEWEYKLGRSAESWTAAANNDASNPSWLHRDDVPNETGSEYTKVFRIRVRNDSENPAFIKLDPYSNTNSPQAYSWSTLHDIRIKTNSSSLRNLLGGKDDITHHLCPTSPSTEGAPNASGANYQLNMQNKSLINIGVPTSKLEDTILTSTDYSFGISRNFYNFYETKNKFVYLTFNGTQSATNTFYANIGRSAYSDASSPDHKSQSFDDLNDVENNSIFYQASSAGRLHSVVFRTSETSLTNGIDFNLYTFNPNKLGGLQATDLTLLGTINTQRVLGQPDPSIEYNYGIMGINSSPDGSFNAGDILVLQIQIMDVADSTPSVHKYADSDQGIIGTLVLAMEEPT